MQLLGIDHPVAHVTRQPEGDYYRLIAKIRRMAGLPVEPEPSLREMTLTDHLHSEIFDDSCGGLLDHWSLRERIDFLNAVENLPPQAKSVRIYDMGYEIWRRRQRHRLTPKAASAVV